MTFHFVGFDVFIGGNFKKDKTFSTKTKEFIHTISLQG
jgi:hypothetical protein